MNEENERFDDLQAELRAMRPRRPSSELARRIGGQLSTAPATFRQSPPSYPRWRLVAAACALVVGLQIWLVL